MQSVAILHLPVQQLGRPAVGRLLLAASLAEALVEAGRDCCMRSDVPSGIGANKQARSHAGLPSKCLFRSLRTCKARWQQPCTLPSIRSKCDFIPPWRRI